MTRYALALTVAILPLFVFYFHWTFLLPIMLVIGVGFFAWRMATLEQRIMEQERKADVHE